MPDLEDTPVEGEPEPSAEAAQGATETETPPWGDDFDASKAWSTITKQRESEKELKEELRRIREDETARTELLQEWGYELADDDEDSSEEGDNDIEFEDQAPDGEVRDPRVDALLAEREQQRIRTDIDRFNEGSDWELDDDDREQIELRARLKHPKGFGPKELEQAHKWYVERLDAKAQVALERAKKPKPKPPHVPAGGKPATEIPDLDDRNERRRWMQEQLQQRQAAS